MNNVTVTDDTVQITIEDLDKLWSFKGTVTIPRASITKVYLRPSDLNPPWLRSPGTFLPRIIAAGTYHGSAGSEFWNTHFKDNCVVFELQEFDYTKVVVDVPDAQELIEKLS